MTTDVMFPDFEDTEQSIINRLPELLRSRCCSLFDPWVGTDSYDHGHSDCYYMRLAADEIERLREQVQA